MIPRSCFSLWVVVLFCAVIFSAAAPLSAGQSQAAPMQAAQSQAPPAQKDAAPEKTSNATSHQPPSDFSGDWQLSWEVRMGTNPGTLHLQQNGTKLTGTFKDLHGLSLLSGSIENNRISFDVQFQGKYPFTTRFTGTAGSGKLEGTSQAIGITGGGGAFLGHGGEVVHPEHPWTATRVTSDQIRSTETSSAAAAPAPAKK